MFYELGMLAVGNYSYDAATRETINCDHCMLLYKKVKFKDADLVGFPIRIALGEKSLAKGEVELKPRGGTLMPVKVDEAVDRIFALLDTASK